MTDHEHEWREGHWFCTDECENVKARRAKGGSTGGWVLSSTDLVNALADRDLSHYAPAIPDDLWAKARAKSAATRVSISEVVRKALEEWVK